MVEEGTKPSALLRQPRRYRGDGPHHRHVERPPAGQQGHLFVGKLLRKPVSPAAERMQRMSAEPSPASTRPRMPPCDRAPRGRTPHRGVTGYVSERIDTAYC